ncbi:MAG: tetratricopeptide repeat protein [Cyanobacteria bacterium SBLK]|nr:tetratricopeptide repeat protein [Cyanobacteria bacterium SBLK]
MAKKKKKNVARSPKKGFGLNVQNIKAGIAKAQKLLASGDSKNALTQLQELDKLYPDRPEVLKYLAYTYHGLGYSALYQLNLEKWVKAATEDSNALLGLAVAYLENDRPSLALETFTLARDKFAKIKEDKEIEETIAELEQAIVEISKQLGMDAGDRTKQIMLLHEKAMSALALNNFAETRQHAEQLLEIEPNFAGALNNLSFAYWFDNQPAEAIALTEQCLEANPNSYHALSNYIAYRTWQGDREGLEEYAEKLKESRDSWQDDPDYWTKAAEAFSWLEEDDSLFKLYKVAEENDKLEKLMGIFYHYLAAAHLRQKRETEARSFWEKALEKSPGLDIAEENLEDLKQPAGKHHSPWSFSGDRWLFGAMQKGVIETISNAEEDTGKLKEAASLCLEKYPELKILIPQMIKRGDPRSRSLAVLLAEYAKTPELLAVLKEFALSDIGPDDIRHEAAALVSNEGLMPAGQTTMWIQGQWQDIFLIGIELHNEMVDEHTPETSKLLEQGIKNLKGSNPEKAEEFLKQALELNPEARDLKYNLAIAYQLQDRDEEAEEICQKLYDRDPNYPFARIALAKYHLDRKEIEKAEELVQPMIQWKSMNHLAFHFLCQLNIELGLVKKEIEKARSWLNIWKQVSDSPNIEYWEERIEHPGGMVDELLEEDDL